MEISSTFIYGNNVLMRISVILTFTYAYSIIKLCTKHVQGSFKFLAQCIIIVFLEPIFNFVLFCSVGFKQLGENLNVEINFINYGLG